MTDVLIEVARARRVAALASVEKRRGNIFHTGDGLTKARPLFVAA